MKTRSILFCTMIFLSIVHLNGLFGQEVAHAFNAKVVKVIEKLEKDISLTDSQKVAILKKADIYIRKTSEMKSVKNNTLKIEKTNKASKEYHAALDSILTQEQKQELELKRRERVEAAVAKATKSQK